MKTLHTGNMYWPTTADNVRRFPKLTESCKTEVAIIGGGVSGLLCAHELASSGAQVALVERGQIAGGSSSANTGLLQFCNDVMLNELAQQIGRAPAFLFYRGCADAIGYLDNLARNLPTDTGFLRRSSLYYASSEQDLPKLKHEFDTLQSAGLSVDYWEGDTIARHFPFRKPGAIVTHGDAEMNPFRFVHALAEAASDRGTRLFEHTDVREHGQTPDGTHRLVVADGHVIEARHVIYSIGYEPEELRGKLVNADLNRSSVIVTPVQSDLSGWHERFMIWETARPYLYVRTTTDNRIIVGGLDEDSKQPLEGSKAIRKHSEKLQNKLKALFPDADASVAYEWNAVFGESMDNLPFIGEDPDWPGVYYSLCYGGNGTVYAAMGARLLRDLVIGKSRCELGDIVSLSRATLTTT